jgi:GntR family transcriptional regulator of arabinose operon
VPYTKTDRLIAWVEDQIKTGKYKSGDKLPSGRELTEMHAVSTLTVKIAMDRLKSAGVVVGVPGSGYYVR